MIEQIIEFLKTQPNNTASDWSIANALYDGCMARPDRGNGARIANIRKACHKSNDVGQIGSSQYFLSISLKMMVKEVCDYMCRESSHFGIVGIVDIKLTTGDRQESDCAIFDHEYVDQYTYHEDCHNGHMYFPIGDDEYLKVEYHS